MLRYLTAGESHGRALVAVLEGCPAGLALQHADLEPDMERRQRGFGRGGRMAIEADRAQILSGVRDGRTLGSPIALLIENRDWANWEKYMAVEPGVIERNEVSRPRPGHADLAGALKYRHTDIRDVLERSSARETAARVAVGAVCRVLLARFGVDVHSHVVEIGGERATGTPPDWADFRRDTEASDVRCADPEAAARMQARIAAAQTAGDTLGGVLEVIAIGLVPGVGSYVQWDRRLDGRLAQAVLATHAIKAVEIGLGFAQSARAGSEVHDPIRLELSERDGSETHAGYGFPRFVAGVTPVLGLLGTVVHFGGALGSLASENLMQNLQTMVGGMGTAFNTTCVALSASITTMLVLFLVERHEDNIVKEVNSLLENELLNRFASTDLRIAPFLDAVKGAQQATLATMQAREQAQLELWSSAISGHATQMQGTLERLDTVHTANAQLAKLFTADQRLLELQARLADNLALLRESQEFDQAVHGLTAAIHMLTARHSQLAKAA